MADLTPEQCAALRTLRTYARTRPKVPAAVRALADVMPQTEIAREAGLSRDGVRKILARHEATDSD